MNPSSVRSVSILVGFLAAGQIAGGGEVIQPAATQSPAAWSVVGEALSNVDGNQVLTVRADNQWARSYATRQLGVHLATKPFFGAQADACPVIEIGSLALVFMANGQTGSLVLAPGEEKAVTLPVSIPLDSNGHSVEAVKVSLIAAGGIARITVGEHTQTANLDSSPDGLLGIVVSAGNSADWSFEEFTITTVDDGVGTEGLGAPDAAPGEDHDQSALKRTGSQGDEVGASVAADLTQGTANGADKDSKSLPTTASTLEVFTPPSVRHGRSEAARAAAFETVRK